MKPRSIYNTQTLAKCSGPRYLPIADHGHSHGRIRSTMLNPKLRTSGNRERQPYAKRRFARSVAELPPTFTTRLAQSLTGILLQLEAAEYDFFENPKAARRKTRRALNLANEAIAETRRYMWTLFHEPITAKIPLRSYQPSLAGFLPALR